MSEIEETLNQIIVSESDKNRSIEDLFMDAIGCLVDANRNRDDRANIYLRPESRNYYEWTIRETFEDSLACAVIKLLEIAKTGKMEISDTDYSRNLTRIEYKEDNISNQLYNTIATIYDDTLGSHKLSIILVKIEVICELLNIDLWHHVELRLKYNQVK